MDTQPIRCIQDLIALAPDWLDLYRRDPAASPFQRPEWLLPWWDVFGSGEVFSFAARDSGKLVALAPMFLHPWNERRQVTFIGNGVSDHLGFLLDPEHAAAATAAIFDAMAQERERWDLCDLQDLSHGAQMSLAPATPHLAHAMRPQYTCQSIRLASSMAEFHSTLPHGLRRNLRRYREQLDQLGRVTFETTRDLSTIAEPFDALVDLHRARWQSKNDESMIGNVALERFHRQAAARLAEAGVIRLHTMRLDGRIIAVVYAWVEQGRAYSYLGGFDPSLSRFSPGALSLEYAIAQSIDEGAGVFDFLRGDEPYKATWGATKEHSYRLLVWHDKVPVDLLQAA